MSSLIVFIEDQIRDERVRLGVNMDSPVDAVIESYVDHYDLPRRYFDLSRIEYRLVRSVDGTHLPGQTTLRQASIAKGELLRLISPKGRRVWRVVQRLLDEIESEIIDQATGEIKERITKKVWDRVTDKLDHIKKTLTGGRRVDQVCEWVEQVKQIGGPPEPVEGGEKSPKVIEPHEAGVVHKVLAKATDIILSSVLTISGGIVISLVGAALVYGLTSPPGDAQTTSTPTVRITAPTIATEPPTPRPPVLDTDGDGLNDAYEVEIGTDPHNPDTDQDGLPDGVEVEGCTNPLNPNTDVDEWGDGDELNRGTNPCDPNDPPRDDDGDGLTNQEEQRLGTDPLNPDSDYDGLSDSHEVAICTSPLDPNTDGDEWGDGDELNRGTNPCDPNDPPPTPTLTPWPCDGPPSDWELYAVRWGDTIRSLAQRRGTTAEWVICYNRLTGPIKIGQLLHLPPLASDIPTATATPTPTATSSPTPTVTPWPCEGPPADWVLYTVRYGDDLYSLARERGTTAELIICYNHLTGPFQAGQLIYLPPEPPTPTPPPTTPAPPLMPDLVIYHLSGPDQAQPGQIINRHMNLMVTNQGEAGADATDVDIVISRDTTINAGDQWIGDGYVPAVVPNQTVMADLTLVQIPEDWPTSEVYIGAILDPLNEQPESDENNNTDRFPINVSAPPPPTPIAPSNLVYDRLGCEPVGLYWQDNAAIEEGYLIFRDGVEFTKLAPNTTSYVDRTATTREYKYGVAAFNAVGLSDIISVVVPENICSGIPETQVD